MMLLLVLSNTLRQQIETTVKNIRSFKDSDIEKTEENQELVKNFLYDIMQGNNLDKTQKYFNGDTYIQHNTAIANQSIWSNDNGKS